MGDTTDAAPAMPLRYKYIWKHHVVGESHKHPASSSKSLRPTSNNAFLISFRFHRCACSCKVLATRFSPRRNTVPTNLTANRPGFISEPPPQRSFTKHATAGTSRRPKSVARRWSQVESIALVCATALSWLWLLLTRCLCSVGIARRREPGRRNDAFYCELIHPTGEGEG